MSLKWNEVFNFKNKKTCTIYIWVYLFIGALLYSTRETKKLSSSLINSRGKGQMSGVNTSSFSQGGSKIWKAKNSGSWLVDLMNRASMFKRPWVVNTGKVFKSFKPKLIERMQKKISFLMGSKHQDMGDLFKVKLFGRKTISSLYGGLTKKQFKWLYTKSKLSAANNYKYVSFFLVLLKSLDVLLYILHIMPSMALSSQAIKNNLISMSGSSLYFTNYTNVSWISYYTKELEAVHFHNYQSELFYMIQFYSNVKKSIYSFVQVLAEISSKILVAMLMPTNSLTKFFNKKLKKNKFSKWIMVKKEWRFKNSFDFLHSYSYMWLLSVLNFQSV